jgi:acylphosphatase
MKDEHRTVQARISGRVQGVGYRVWTRGEAMRLGLTGWVRNESDGSVSTLLAGDADAVATMIERLRQGPGGAAVAKVEIVEMAHDAAPADFRITP